MPGRDSRHSLDDKVIPPWDAKLTAEQTAEWTAAEAKLGIRRSVTSWLATKRKRLARALAAPLPPAPQPGQAFLAAAAYAGPVQGYHFGTTDEQIGYHMDIPQQPTVISLAAELDSPQPACNLPTPPKPTRRRLDQSGNRLRRKSRRWNSLRGQAGRTELLADVKAAEISWKPPSSAGLWTIDSTNPNCGATGVRQVAKRTTADVVLMQETKLRAAKTRAAVSQAERLGWRVQHGAALATALHGTSGGTAVLSRKGVGS